MRGVRERLRGRAEFLSVDIRSPAGQEFARRHGLHPFQTAVFDHHGRLVKTTAGLKLPTLLAALEPPPPSP